MNERDFTSLHLVRAAQEGDEHAEGQLLARYLGQLLPLVNGRLPSDLKPRFDAEDVVQSACRVFIQRVRDGEVTVIQRGDLWQQLLTVTLNKIRSNVRKHRRASRKVSSETEGTETHFLSREPTPEDAQLFKETVDEILMDLDNPKHRQVIVLRLRGESTSEISRTTGYSVERVRQIVRGIKSRLERRNDDGLGN